MAQNNKQRVHIIAVGGAVMHNLALALKRSGWEVSGSDDEIFDPSKGRLAAEGLLPESFGWHPEKLSTDLDLVILGMHARADNPELLRAKELGLNVVSFPEFFALNSTNKKRVAVAGSHGKTTTTSMILHVLRTLNKPVDYLVGSLVEGFDLMVKIGDDAPLLVVEADEYLTSPIDPRPKFIWYTPHISVITGIAWDHMNVFKTEEIYQDQFRQFLQCHEPSATVIYCADDPALVKLVGEFKDSLKLVPYSAHPYQVKDNKALLITESGEIPLHLFGRHNMSNLEAARLVCREIGIEDRGFYGAIQSFKGARFRLETVFSKGDFTCIRDFAHAPSKVHASTKAARERFSSRQLIACVELHTYSSLNKDFLPQYAGALDQADKALVFFDPKVVSLKKLENLDPDWIKDCFGRKDLAVVSSKDEVVNWIKQNTDKSSTLLMMSSGSWGGINLQELGQTITE